ncbi:MAG TPA: hypothetical protein VEH10_06015 [Thermoplasmata archaeon]|nr:hypothetical protein [Thermoplasmata archaeon]
MRPTARTGVVVTVVSVAVSFLTICVPGAAGAHPTPGTDAAASTATSWAYGTVRSATATGAGGMYAYSATATAGFAVILSETAISTGNYTLQVHRTMGLLLSVTYCRPSCQHPVETATVRFHAWEDVGAAVNLTTAANVTVNGSPVAALGIASSSASVAVGIRETSSVVLSGALSSSRNLTVDLDANSSTMYSPALGLVPLEMSTGEAWTSTSAFVGTGLASWSLKDTRIGGLHPGTVDQAGNLSLNQTGTVSVGGDDPGTVVHFGGTSYDVLNLTITRGPFALREGFLLIPTGSDLFGPTAPSWLTANAVGTGSANVSPANIDVTSRLNAPGHLGFEGSGMWLRSATTNPAQDAVAGPGTGPAPAVSSPATGSNATYLQGQPESVGQATTDQNCLATGLGCPAGGAARLPLGTLVALGILGAAAVIAAGVIAERRRLPPTSYPNAALYPPGTASRHATAEVRPPGKPPAPAEDDPLSHLW